VATTSTNHTSTTPTDELSVWLRDGWKMMFKHFPALVVIALVADLPLTFIGRATENISNGLLSTFVTISSIAVITPIAKAAAIVAIHNWDDGEEGAILTAFQALVRNFHIVLAASILWCVAVFVGVGLLIIPGIVVLMLGQCLMGAIILEKRSIRDSIKRSRSLVKPRFWNVLALFAIVQAVAGIASGIVETSAGSLISGVPLDIVTRALTSPIAFAPLAMMFLRTSRVSDR